MVKEMDRQSKFVFGAFTICGLFFYTQKKAPILILLF